MDDQLLAEFHSIFTVGGDVNDPSRPHPSYSSLYKQKRNGYGDQEARRRRLLEEQKTRRKKNADYTRRIVEGEEWEEEMEEEDWDEVDVGESMELPHNRKRKKKVHPYRNQLMLSEWLVDIPPDFHENWFMTVCPIGRRSLVISAKSTTVAYSRSGAFLNCFPSTLPGGCKRMCHSARDYSILDCIYHEPSRTYYVLDIMCWMAHPVYDTDRDFRYYWLQTKLGEAEKVDEHSRLNPYRFLPLDSFPCSRESLAEVFSKKWPVEVDGLLFFHKQCHYTTGRSPLAAWLKAHMVTDILDIPVSEEFLSCAPSMSDPLAEPGKEEGRRKGGERYRHKRSKVEDMESEHTSPSPQPQPLTQPHSQVE